LGKVLERHHFLSFWWLYCYALGAVIKRLKLRLKTPETGANSMNADSQQLPGAEGLKPIKSMKSMKLRPHVEPYELTVP